MHVCGYYITVLHQQQVLREKAVPQMETISEEEIYKQVQQVGG